MSPQVVVSSRYRCTTHPDEPVTWRGTGCARCEREQHRPRRRHRPNRAPNSAAWVSAFYEDEQEAR